MEKNSCLLAIKHIYASLTPVEKKIADYIVANCDRVVDMTISEFAHQADVVPSAVTRCCKSLGFIGFAQMKVSLSAELSKNKQLNFSPYIYQNDSTNEILDKVFSANAKALHDTAERVDRTEFAAVVRLMSSAKSIYIYGVGTSAIFVNEFQYRLMQQGFTVFAHTDIITMKVSTLNIAPGDIVIGISHGGRTMPVIDTVRLAKERGAKAICITSYPQSLITTVCDHTIAVYSDEIQYPIEAMSARIAHLSIIDAMIIALSVLHVEQAEARLESTHKMIESYRYHD